MLLTCLFYPGHIRVEKGETEKGVISLFDAAADPIGRKNWIR